MSKPVIVAVEVILNKLTNGMHETTRLNKLEVKSVKPNPSDLLTLKTEGIDITFLDAFHPESESAKKAQFIDTTLDQAAKLMIEINSGTLRPIYDSMDVLTIIRIKNKLNKTSEMNSESDEEEKKAIKNKIGILNGMLKKMIPLYGMPTQMKASDKSPITGQNQIVRVISNSNSPLIKQEIIRSNTSVKPENTMNVNNE